MGETPIKVLQEKHGAESPTDIYPKTSVDAVEGLKKYVLDLVYPVGSIYITTAVTDPSTTLGGTWEKYAEGRTIIGANATYPAGSTGGEAKHTLSTAEMPSHLHNFGDKDHPIWTSTAGYKATGKVSPNDADGIPAENGYCEGVFKRGAPRNYRASGSSAKANVLEFELDWTHNHSFYGNTGSSGSTTAHNNMQPYIATYIWKRTA